MRAKRNVSELILLIKKIKPNYRITGNLVKYYDLTILSDVLTKISAAEIGRITITVAKIKLLKNALNDGVIFF